MQKIFEGFVAAKGLERFTIVGSTEARPAEGRISNESPVGRALLGKHKYHLGVLNAAAAKGDWGKPLPAGRRLRDASRRGRHGVAA